MAKNIMEGGYIDFIAYLSKEHPGLRSKFPAQIEWSFLGDSSGVKRPFDMTVEDFDEFRRIEFEWLIENGYVTQYKGTSLFKVAVDGLVSISLDRLVRVLKITDNMTRIVVLNTNDDEDAYDVVGDIDWVNKKLGIAKSNE